MSQTGGRPIIVAGALSGSVARVVVRYERGSRLRRAPAVAIKVRDRALLRAIGVRRPFGRYLAEVPRGARALSAEARSARGRPLGLAFFEGSRGPIGEGRRCYSRPRISSLRLVRPVRAGRESWLRVVVSYPGGYIGSVEASVGGAGTVHADLILPPTQRAGGRSVVKLPLPIRRRGTVGVQVTAEGLPRDRRCGRNPPLRQSRPKTLLVRVR